MRALSVIICALSVAILGGCETQKGYQKQLAQFKGSQTELLIQELGEPSKVNLLEDGREVWVYESEKQLQRGGYFDHVYYRTADKFETNDGKVKTRKFVDARKVWVPRYTIKSECKTYFVILKNDVVAEFNFRGNGCLANEWGV